MKRRDALKGAFTTAGLIAGTVLSADQPMQQPNLSWGPQPHYFVLYMFQHVIDEFVPIGIYTKRADADEHEKRARAAMEKTEVREAGGVRYRAGSAGTFCGAVAERSHEELCYELADLRLGALASKLKTILELEPGEGRLNTLYGKSEFPLAIAKS